MECFSFSSKSFLNNALLVLFAVSVSIFTTSISLAQALQELPEPKPCDTCEDLCLLMDQYLQREMGVELWRQYALSTPKDQRKKLPSKVTNARAIEEKVQEEFETWTRYRRLPCTPMRPTWSPLNPDELSNVSTDLETVTSSGCEIIYNKQKMEWGSQTQKEFESAVNCKVLSDATLAHENVHQEHCMNAYSRNPEAGESYLNTPEVVAESELQAWTRQKEILAEAIRNIVRRQGCGWQPTTGQKKDMNALPSIQQSQDMQNRGWKAVKALSRRKGG